jgi:hypothetical protein
VEFILVLTKSLQLTKRLRRDWLLYWRNRSSLHPKLTRFIVRVRRLSSVSYAPPGNCRCLWI